MISGTTSSSPLSYERAAGEKIPGAFRDGTRLVVHRGADISQICLCCGRPTNGHRIVKCLHSNSFGSGGSSGSAGGGSGTAFDVILLIFYLIMLVIWIIAALADFAESRTRTVTYGLCESHRSLRSTLGWTAWASLIGGTFALVGGMVVLARARNGGLPVAGIAAVAAGPVLWIVAAIAASRMPGVSLVREAGTELWLKGAAKKVVEAQPQRIVSPAEQKAKASKAMAKKR